MAEQISPEYQCGDEIIVRLCRSKETEEKQGDTRDRPAFFGGFRDNGDLVLFVRLEDGSLIRSIFPQRSVAALYIRTGVVDGDVR